MKNIERIKLYMIRLTVTRFRQHERQRMNSSAFHGCPTSFYPVMSVDLFAIKEFLRLYYFETYRNKVSNNFCGSIGLDRWASILISRDFLTSCTKALAVMAMIGIVFA